MESLEPWILCDRMVNWNLTFEAIRGDEHVMDFNLH